MSNIDDRFEIRRYEDGDESGIVEAWEKAFGRPMSLEYWNWKFKQNPVGEAVISVVVDRRTNEIVGHLAAIPANASLLGRPILAYQPVDGLMTEEAVGGGFFGRLVQSVFSVVYDTKSVVSYAAPNHQSLHAVVTYAKHIKLAYLSRYSLSANYAFKRWGQLVRLTVAQIRQHAIGSEIEIEHQAVVPHDYDSLWRTSRRNEILCIWKDKDYLEWRFANCPNEDFKFASARVNGKLKALLIYSTDGKGRTSMAEVVCDIMSEDIAQHLVRATCIRLLRHGGTRIGFYGASAGYYSQIFNDLNERTNTRFPVLIRYMGDDPHVEKLVENPNNWTVSWGDTDIV